MRGGAAEQDADEILLIYREEQYGMNTTLKGIAEIIIAGRSNGPTGEAMFVVLGRVREAPEELPAGICAGGVFR